MRFFLYLLFLTSFITACSTSNSQLVAKLPNFNESEEIKPKIIWSSNINETSANFSPIMVDNIVYTANKNGQVFALSEGKILWSVDLATKITSATGSNGQIVVVVNAEGTVIALAAKDGKEIWRKDLNLNVIAPPAVSENLVAIRTGNNQLFVFSSERGEKKWVFQKNNPPLILSHSASPLFADEFIFLGMPAGKLVALKTTTGALIWEGQVSQAKGATELERVADIATIPARDGRSVCASAYQGQTSCFDMGEGGKKLWSKDIPSHYGLSIYASLVFINDARGNIYALARNSGTQIWRQDKLQTRAITAPIALGKVVAVGDLEGYVHFMNTSNGEIQARIATDGSQIVGRPQVIADKLLIQTEKGGIFYIGLNS